MEDAEAFLRLQPHDGQLDGDMVVSTAFVVDTVAPQIIISVSSISNVPVSPVVTVNDGLDSNPELTLILDGLPWVGGTVSAEGHHTLEVTARDNFGNTAAASASFTVDQTPPAVTFDGAVDGGVYDDDVTASWMVIDNLDPAPAVDVTHPSPFLFDFSGHYAVEVTATDWAGNATMASLRFSIYDLDDLPSIIASLGLDAGLENSLVSKIENAIASRDQGNLNAAVNKLEAFIHAVDAQRGKKIAVEDADMLVDFALNLIALLEGSWSSLSLGEVFIPADDPTLANPIGLLDTLEANAVSRVIVKLYRATGSGAGRVSAGETVPWAGVGSLSFEPAPGFDPEAFLVEADRRGIEVLAGMDILAAGIDPGDIHHVDHLVDVAAYLLEQYSGFCGVCLTRLEAPGRSEDITSLVSLLHDEVAVIWEGELAILVDAPADDVELSSLVVEKGQDVNALGSLAGRLYLATGVNEDVNADGVHDAGPGHAGAVVAYLAGRTLPCALVPLLPTGDVMEPFTDFDGDGLYDADEFFEDVSGDGVWGPAIVMTPERITAIVSGLPGADTAGIAVFKYSDTSAVEWEAILNSHPR